MSPGELPAGALHPAPSQVRLAPPRPPCGPYAGVQHRRRLRASGVGCSLAPSPTAPSPFASSRAKRSRLRHRRPPPRFPAPPPGGRLRLAPWPDARPCADGALRHGPTEQRPPGQSLLRPRTAAAVAAAAPPFPSVCLVCESVLSVTPVPASCVSPPRLRLSPLISVKLSVGHRHVPESKASNSLLSVSAVSRVSCARGDCNRGGLRSF